MASSKFISLISWELEQLRAEHSYMNSVDQVNRSISQSDYSQVEIISKLSGRQNIFISVLLC